MSDMATALRGQGFTDIVFLGDSGSNTGAMRATADSLNAKWAAEPPCAEGLAAGTCTPAAPAAQRARLHHVTEYYSEDQWSCEFLKEELGIFQQPDNCSATRDLYHDDVHYTSIVATTDPDRIRVRQRIDAGQFSINGVDLKSVENVLAIGNRLIEHRAEITVRAMRALMGGG
jgi:creatinine amidohydrolase/Fe(II)-dependent formamide hydrolase-like protein